jgi:transposase
LRRSTTLVLSGCSRSPSAKATWTEQSPLVEPGGLLTVRAGVEICRLVGAEGMSVAAAARSFGVSWATAMARVRRHGQPLVDGVDRVATTASLGVDETVFQHSNPRRWTGYVTGFVDLDRGLLLDVVAGRSGRVVADWLEARPDEWLAGVTVAAIDAFRGHATALAAGLPAATLVMDCFHAVALANRCVDAVRRRVNNETLGHRGRRDDPLYRIRRVCLVGAERLNERGWERLIAGIEVGDPSGHLGAAWIGKEELRRVYAARSEEAARRALTRFYAHCADHDDVPEVLRLAKTLSARQDQILAYHRTGRASNGPTEAVNLLIEKTRRIGHGFRNFDNNRLRWLLACGIRWQNSPVARLRGRQPRSAAKSPNSAVRGVPAGNLLYGIGEQNAVPEEALDVKSLRRSR